MLYIIIGTTFNLFVQMQPQTKQKEKKYKKQNIDTHKDGEESHGKGFSLVFFFLWMCLLFVSLTLASNQSVPAW